MAQRTVVILMDDLDGTEGTDTETVPFAFEGVSYEIDLTKENREALSEALAPYVGAARRLGRAPAATPRKSPEKAADSGGEDLDAIRAWARKNGHEVADRGRVAQAIKDAYYAATR